MDHHRGTATSVFYRRDEPYGLGRREVEHEIVGSVTRTGTRLSAYHPEDFEVEVISAWRIDPVTAERVPVAAKDWFTDDELQKIQQFLASAFEHEVRNELDPTANE